VLQGMSQKIPESHVPYFNEWIALYFSKLFLKAGLPSNEKERSQNVLVGRNGLGRKALMNLAVEYAQSFENYHLSEEILDILLQKYPDDRQALLTLTHIHESAGQINRAVMRLTEWIKQHPDDQLAQSRLSKLLEQRDLDSGNIP